MQEHHIQILLDEERYQKVANAAEQRGTSIATVIREAIDRMTADQDRRRAAIQAILAAEPVSLPADPCELRRELGAAHDRIPD